MKLLVTGGCGFIGSNFIHYWLKHHRADEMVNLDLLTYAGNLENLADVENNGHYHFVKGDIRDPHVVEEVMPGVHTVVHFAAESHVDRSLFAASDFVTTNVLGTQILCAAAAKHNVLRFHFVGTDEIYGELPLGSASKFKPDWPFNPRNQYAASKAAAQNVAMSYFYTHGLPVTITNCTNNFGPFQHPEKFIPLAVTNLLEGKDVPVYGDGLNVRDWLYVEDHCRAIDVVLSGGTVGKNYLVGAAHEDISNLDLVRKIVRIMGKGESSIEFVRDRQGHDRRYAVDWSEIAALGWAPQHDLDEWLEATIRWYKRHRDWWQRVKSGQYREYYEKVYGLQKTR